METNVPARLLQSFFFPCNDMELIVEEETLVDLVLQVACGAVGKQEVASFMRTQVQPGRSAEDS